MISFFALLETICQLNVFAESVSKFVFRHKDFGKLGDFFDCKSLRVKIKKSIIEIDNVKN